MNLTIYGDSILKGVLFENDRYVIDRTWESRLSERAGLHISNCSRFGSTISKAMARIRQDSKTPGEGIALLEFGGNDCDYDWKEIAANPDAAHNCKTPPEQFKDSLRTAIRLLRESGRTPVLANLPPISSELFLSFLCRGGLSRERILQWLGDPERIAKWQESYSRLVEEVAAEEHTPLIDLRTPFEKAGQKVSELLCPDGIHPSRLGQSLIFDTLCGALA